MGILGTFVTDLSFPLITVLSRVFTPIPDAPHGGIYSWML